MSTSRQLTTLPPMKTPFNAPAQAVGLVWCSLLACAHPGVALAAPEQQSGAQANPPTTQPITSPDSTSAKPGLVVAPATLPAAAQPVITFNIDEVQVEGNTVLPVPLIERLLLPYAGPGKTALELEAARAQLEKLYQEAGFITVVVDLDNDAVSRGLLKLLVIEGKVERVKVVGAQYVSPAAIRRDVPELAEGKVPNFNAVQQQLIAANKGDARRVQPIIRPGLTPGTVETELQVADQLPLSLNLELNNRQAPSTRPLRLNATLRYDNLFQADHSLSLTVITAPQDTAQSKVGVISYTLPAGDGATWALYALSSDSLVEAVGAATVVGKGRVEGVRYVQPLPGLADFSHSLTWGVDHKEFRERIGTDVNSPTTPLTYLPFSLAYNANMAGERSQDTVTATLTMASRDLLRREVDCAGYAQKVDQFACKNPDADGSFTTLRLDWRHNHALFGKWNGLIRLGGQVSSQPLVNNEQYTLGGVDNVRGYLDAEVSGDKAVLASVELQSPNWAAGSSWTWLQEFSGLAFVDSGRAYITDASAGVPEHSSLQSVGVGLKLKAATAMSGDLSVAWPQRVASKYTELHKPRLNARLAWQF